MGQVRVPLQCDSFGRLVWCLDAIRREKVFPSLGECLTSTGCLTLREILRPSRSLVDQKSFHRNKERKVWRSKQSYREHKRRKRITDRNEVVSKIRGMYVGWFRRTGLRRDSSGEGQQTYIQNPTKTSIKVLFQTNRVDQKKTCPNIHDKSDSQKTGRHPMGEDRGSRHSACHTPVSYFFSPDPDEEVVIETRSVQDGSL